MSPFRRLVVLGCMTLATACSGGGGGGGSSATNLADKQGVGGGIVVADVFPGANIQKVGPSTLDIQPQSGQSGITDGVAPAVLFSESMNVRTAPGTVHLQDSQGKTVASTLAWSYQQQLVVIRPNQPLAAGTYNVVVDGKVQDLTGHLMAEAVSGSSRVVSSFQVGASGGALKVLQFAPAPGSSNVYVGTVVAVVFSEPVKTGKVPGSVELPGAIEVHVNGVAVAGKLTIKAKGRLVEFKPNEALPNGASVDVVVNGSVTAVSGRSLGNGTSASFRTIDFASPDLVSFPDNTPISNPVQADGVIADRVKAASLHQFLTDLAAHNVDTLGVFFVDPSLNGGNGFRFEQSGDGVQLTTDLQPVPATPALGDGIVKVGAYAIRNGVIGPIDVVKTLYKDTSLFEIVELGPPNGTDEFSNVDRLLAIRTRDSAVFGTFDSPSGPFTLTTSGDTGFPGPSNGNAQATWRAIRQIAGGEGLPDQTSFTDGENGTPNVFVTGAPDQELPPSYDPIGLDLSKAKDAFGNKGSADLSNVAVAQVGLVGGNTMRCIDPYSGNDPDLCLYVSVTDAEKLVPISADSSGNLGADVMLEGFPPSPGGFQIAPRSSPATFGEVDFASLGNPDRLTLTIVKDGYNIVTYAGIPNPVVAQRPFGMHILLQPKDTGVAIPVQVRDKAGSGLKVQLGGNELKLFDPDLRLGTPGLPGDFTTTTWNPLHLKALVGFGTRESGRYQIAVDVPHIRDTEPLVLDFSKAKVFDSASAAAIKIFATRSDADQSRVSEDGSDVNINLAEVRLNAHLPGFTGVVPIFVDTKLSKTGGDDEESVGVALLPNYFFENADGTNPANDDSPLELIIQPSLAGAGQPVSADALARVFHTEYVLRNKDDGRLTVQRSPIDFSNLTSPRALFERSHLPRIPAFDLSSPFSHPPLVKWDQTIAKEGYYLVHLIKKNGFGTSDRTWDVYLAAGATFASQFQFPVLDAGRGFKNDIGDFSGPGSYGLVLDGYGFDVDDPSTANDDNLVQFDFDGFLVGETEQRFSTHVRTEQNLVITTQ